MPTLRLFGYPTLEIEAPSAILGRATQRHRLALLALLAAHRTGLSRDKLIGMLWPESPTERARSSLSESLYVLRRCLGDEAIVSTGDEVRLDARALTSDLREFEEALDRGDARAAVDAYRGPFLDGFFVARAPEFERWSEGERRRLARAYANGLECLATAAAKNGDESAASGWWRRLAALEPYDARIAVALMRSLDRAGDRAGALAHARVHTSLIRHEFGIEPDPAVASLESLLRSGTTRDVAPTSNAASADNSGAVSSVGDAMRSAPNSLTTANRTLGLRAFRPALALAMMLVVVGGMYSASTLMSRDRQSRTWRHSANGSTALELPVSEGDSSRGDSSSFSDLMTKGRTALAHHREPETRVAAASFRAAIARDSSVAAAHAGLAIAAAEMHLRFSSPTDAPVWADIAVREARRALELDSTLSEVHEALAAVHRKTEFDWDGTINESRRALALNPTAPTPHFYIGGALYHLGLLEQAERAVRAGLEASASADRAEALRTLGTVALASGRYQEAVSLFQDVQRISDRPVSDPHLAAAYYYSGDTVRAITLLQTLAASSSASAASRARALLASIAAARGDRAHAAALLAQTTAGQMDHHVAYSIGVTNAMLGQPHEAVRWLRVAAETGFRCYPWYSRDPLLASLRGDPEFVAFMRELGKNHDRDATRYRSME